MNAWNLTYRKYKKNGKKLARSAGTPPPLLCRRAVAVVQKELSTVRRSLSLMQSFAVLFSDFNKMKLREQQCSGHASGLMSGTIRVSPKCAETERRPKNLGR